MAIRYFGIDIHKAFVMVAVVNRDQEPLQAPQRIEMIDLESWAAQSLGPQDRCAVEVTNNVWHVHDILAQHAGEVVVVDPFKTKLIAHARIKSDKIDALALARLLASNFVYEVCVPDETMRKHRQLAVHHTSLTKKVRRVKSQIHSLLARRNLSSPESELFSKSGRTWLQQIDLPPVEALLLQQLLAQLDLFEKQKKECAQLIAQLALPDERVTRLMQVPGINYFTAFALLAVVGDIHRFSSPEQFCSYFGLTPSLHQSGNSSFQGHITRSGNSQIRWLMIEAAWTAVRWDPHWKKVYEALKHRRGAHIAIVAVARKLLVVIWHLLYHQRSYYYLKPAMFVRKLQDWIWSIGKAELYEGTSMDFVRQRLKSIGFHDLALRLTTNRKGKLMLIPA